MEILKTVEKVEVAKGCVSAVIEHCKTLKRKVKHSSADPRAGNYTSDVHADVALITVNGKKEYLCHISNGINEAVDLFNSGEFKKYLPKL